MAPATDRLSLLPTSLIAEILSLCPLKDAVKTSVLAQAWRYTWRSMSNIDINESNFPSIHYCLYFTHQWLSHYPHATIDRFSLTLYTPPPDVHTHPLIQAFVDFALDCETKSLELDLPGPAFELPESVYEYDLLDHLKLFSCSFTVENFINLTWLKTVTLGRMALKNYVLKDLLMGCPLLESLSLVECVDETEFTVVSPRMRSFVVEGCLDLLHLTVTTPKLRRIKYVGKLIGFETMTNLTMLEEADLDITGSPNHDEESGELVQNLLVSFKHATVLTVCSYITQALATASNPYLLPQNIEVEHLTIKSTLDQYEVMGIACLLRSSPSLNKIQFDVGPREIVEDDWDTSSDELDTDTFWGDYLRESKCLKESLNEVEMNGYGAFYTEVQFLKFFVDFGAVLTTVRVRVARIDQWRELVREMTTLLEMWRRNAIYRNKINIVVE